MLMGLWIINVNVPISSRLLHSMPARPLCSFSFFFFFPSFFFFFKSAQPSMALEISQFPCFYFTVLGCWQWVIKAYRSILLINLFFQGMYLCTFYGLRKRSGDCFVPNVLSIKISKCEIQIGIFQLLNNSFIRVQSELIRWPWSCEAAMRPACTSVPPIENN